MNLARLFNTVCKLPKIKRIDIQDRGYYNSLRTGMLMDDHESTGYIIGHSNIGEINPVWSQNWEDYQEMYKR